MSFDHLEQGIIVEHRREPWFLRMGESDFVLESTDDENKTIEVPFFQTESRLLLPFFSLKM